MVSLAKLLRIRQGIRTIYKTHGVRKISVVYCVRKMEKFSMRWIPDHWGLGVQKYRLPNGKFNQFCNKKQAKTKRQSAQIIHNP
jgi:hypothetical protein